MNREKVSINIITLGCSKNTVDSEKLIRQLELNDFRVSHNSDVFSDIVIINTCGFILDAKKESIDTILRISEAKKKGLIKKLFVIGCLSQRYRQSLKLEIPLIDELFGVDEQNKILEALAAKINDKYLFSRTLTTPGGHYAYLKISEGCNRKCSFCAIPMIKGRHHSFPIEKLLDEARELENAGVKELILIAQDIISYGKDLYNKRSLPVLVNELSKLNGIEWIRIHYTYPEALPLKELASLFINNPKVCRYLDIPLQHINQGILKSMRRGYDKHKIYEYLEYFKKKIPDIAFRTTLISGYPGETEKEFRELYDFIKEIKFDRLGVFPYSHEEGTYAGEKLKDNIPEKVKTERTEALMEVQQSISYEKNKQRIGKTYKVIVDALENDYFRGRTEYDSPEIDNEVIIPASNALTIGKFYDIKIMEAMEYDLSGTLQNPL